MINKSLSLYKNQSIYTYSLFLLSTVLSQASEPATINVASGATGILGKITFNLLKEGPGNISVTDGSELNIVNLLEGTLYQTTHLGANNVTVTTSEGTTFVSSSTINGSVQSAGTVAPSLAGVSITNGVHTLTAPLGSTMTITGDYSQTATGALAISMNQTSCDQIIAHTVSSVDSNGKILLYPIRGYYPTTKTYPVISWTSGSEPTVPTAQVQPIIVLNNAIQNVTSNLSVSALTLDSVNNRYVITITPVDYNATSTLTLDKVLAASGNIILTQPTTSLDATNQSNPVNIPNPVIWQNQDIAFSITIPKDLNFTLSGPLTGTNAILNVTGPSGQQSIDDISKTVFNVDSDMTNFKGTLNASQNVSVAMANAAANTAVILNNYAYYNGGGTISSLAATNNSGVNLGLETLNITGGITMDGTSTISFQIDPSLNAGHIKCGGEANFDSANQFYPLLKAGTYTLYPQDDLSVYKVTVLTATGKININADIDKKKYIKTLSDDINSAAVFTPTINQDQTTLSYTISSSNNTTQTLTVGSDEVEMDNPTYTELTDFSSLPNVTTNQTAPASEIPDATNVAFQKTDTIDYAALGTADTFRFRRVIQTKNTYRPTENMLKALAAIGPVSVQKNETRIWMSPYLNRSRTNNTSTEKGNQGWSGGSLFGAEKRDKKNTWLFGVLGGISAGRSHLNSTPQTCTITSGYLFGLYHNYRITPEWGYELLGSRYASRIQSTRGIFSNGTQTGNATGQYTSYSNLLNAQLNYLFNIVKSVITCRINIGASYQNLQTNQFSETGAGTNNLLTLANHNNSLETYSGVGLRYIWKTKDITIRLTGVYEYGYSHFSRGNTIKQIAYQAVSVTNFTSAPQARSNKHYAQLNLSYLDTSTGLKFIASYAGKFFKKVRNHTAMLKIEYRF